MRIICIYNLGFSIKNLKRTIRHKGVCCHKPRIIKQNENAKITPLREESGISPHDVQWQFLVHFSLELQYYDFFNVRFTNDKTFAT